MATMGNVHLDRAIVPTEDARALVEELEAELSQHYPPEQRHGLAIDALFQPHIRFFVARLEGEAVGCGGIAVFSDFAEVKRMYVRPHARGNGVADKIIDRLAEEATSAGIGLLRLETGSEQVAAMRFYERCGFEFCEAFEPYASMPPQSIATSVFMEKRLEEG